MESSRSFSDAFGHTIELTPERWFHVLAEHQELEAFDHLIPETLQAPDDVVRSIYDPKVGLYYKWFPSLWHGKYFVVVVQFNRHHFILTAYITDKIKGGVRLWPSG